MDSSSTRRTEESKSLGNTVTPQEVIKESGARSCAVGGDERLQEELRVGKEILTRVIERTGSCGILPDPGGESHDFDRQSIR